MMYDELSNRIKTNYKLKRTNMKATLQKQVYVMIMLTGYIVLNYICLCDLHFTLEIILGTPLGLIWISLGFNVMYDASHYAFFTNPGMNNHASKLWNAFSSWSHNMWFYHHILSHHSFTNTDIEM